MSDYICQGKETYEGICSDDRNSSESSFREDKPKIPLFSLEILFPSDFFKVDGKFYLGCYWNFVTVIVCYCIKEYWSLKPICYVKLRIHILNLYEKFY